MSGAACGCCSSPGSPAGPCSWRRSRLNLGKLSSITHKEKNTNVPLAPVSAILYGKIHGRILSAGRLLQRDAYDLAVACLVDKGVVAETPELIPAEDKESILIRVRDARQGRAVNDRTLLAPKYPEAEMLAGAVLFWMGGLTLPS